MSQRALESMFHDNFFLLIIQAWIAKCNKSWAFHGCNSCICMLLLAWHLTEENNVTENTDSLCCIRIYLLQISDAAFPLSDNYIKVKHIYREIIWFTGWHIWNPLSKTFNTLDIQVNNKWLFWFLNYSKIICFQSASNLCCKTLL